MSAYGNYSYSEPSLDSHSGPNLESFANLSNTVRGQRVDAFGALSSVSRGRMRFSRQYLVVALALGLVVGLPIVSAQATSIHPPATSWVARAQRSLQSPQRIQETMEAVRKLPGV